MQEFFRVMGKAFAIVFGSTFALGAGAGFMRACGATTADVVVTGAKASAGRGIQ